VVKNPKLSGLQTFTYYKSTLRLLLMQNCKLLFEVEVQCLYTNVKYVDVLQFRTFCQQCNGPAP